MKIKGRLNLFFALIMVIGTFSMCAYAEDEVKVLIDGIEIVFDVPPQLIDNRTMVPMRKIFEEMGASVEWDINTKTITATKDNISVSMQINNSVITVCGESIVLDVPPQLVNDRTLVPVRAVAEGLKAQVDWDESSKTVIIITADSGLQTITAIDLNKQTDFICNVGATITYGFYDMWNRTVGTEFVPYVSMINSAYRGQVVLISPIYANFAIDDSGYAKVTFSVKQKKSDGREDYLGKDIVAIDGTTMPNQLIKSITDLEYMIDETDPLGKYTFVIESKDVIGNKTTENVFTVDFQEYKYEKNEFESSDELAEFVCKYSRNPNPDRIIDAIIYAEKNDLITYPIYFTGFVEMLAKNPYISRAAIEEFEKEFGTGGTDTLLLLDNTAAQYLNAILSSDPPTMTQVAVTSDIDGKIMLYGSAVGAYLTGASYDAAKVLIQSLGKYQFSKEDMIEYGVPEIEFLIENDSLFKAYCEYMVNYDGSLDSKTKEIVSKLLEK